MIRLLLTLCLATEIWKNCASLCTPSKEAGEPLILTPFVKSGNVSLARKKSYVEPPLSNIFSHSGYFTVNETTDSNLFFWFFKQTSSEWASRPVILWLQGGPGCSSIFGLFTENGPFHVENGKLKKTEYSWTNHYNVLYIDNPIGAGFSFTRDYYVTTEREIGEHLYDALNQFFHLFPELKKNEFFISGESYAGKYVPVLAYEIYKRNPASSLVINLKGLFIGNGYSDPENMHDYAEHLHRLGLIDHKEKSVLQRVEEKTNAMIRNKSWDKAQDFASKEWLLMKKFTNFSHLYDYTKRTLDGVNSYVQLVNEDKFRKRIHVGQTKYYPCSLKAYQHLKNDGQQSVKPIIEELLEVYPVMFFSGQLDIIVAHYLTSDFIKQLHWSRADDCSGVERERWYVRDHLAGYYKSCGNLKEVLIRGAGHMVPMKRALCLLDVLDKFVNSEI